MTDQDIFNIAERLQKVEYLLPTSAAPAASQLLQDQRSLLREVTQLRATMRSAGMVVDGAPEAA